MASQQQPPRPGPNPDAELAALIEKYQVPAILGMGATFMLGGAALGFRHQTRKYGSGNGPDDGSIVRRTQQQVAATGRGLTDAERAAKMARRMPENFNVYAFAGRAFLYGTALCGLGAAAVTLGVRHGLGIRSFKELGNYVRGQPVQVVDAPRGNSIWDLKFWLSETDEGKQEGSAVAKS